MKTICEVSTRAQHKQQETSVATLQGEARPSLAQIWNTRGSALSNVEVLCLPIMWFEKNFTLKE